MATRPPRKPLIDMPTSHFFERGYTNTTATRPAAQAARVVLAATRPMPVQSIADSVEPGLKPSPPNPGKAPAEGGVFRAGGGGRPPAITLKAPAEAGPEGDRARQCDEATNGVDDRRAGEVTEDG